jgi:hypothetical protein
VRNSISSDLWGLIQEWRDTFHLLLLWPSLVNFYTLIRPKHKLVYSKNGVFCDVMPCGSLRTDVSEELSASIIRVTRIGELGTTLAVTSNRRTLQVLWESTSVSSFWSFTKLFLGWNYCVSGLCPLSRLLNTRKYISETGSDWSPDRRKSIALSTEPIWVYSTWRQTQNPVSEMSRFTQITGWLIISKIVSYTKLQALTTCKSISP